MVTPIYKTLIDRHCDICGCRLYKINGQKAMYKIIKYGYSYECLDCVKKKKTQKKLK